MRLIAPSSGKIAYKFECAKAHLGTCWDRYTGWQHGGMDYETYYLDRIHDLHVNRAHNEVFNAIQLKNRYHSGWFKKNENDFQFFMRICELRTPETPKNILGDKKGSKYNTNERDENARRRR